MDSCVTGVMRVHKVYLFGNSVYKRASAGVSTNGRVSLKQGYLYLSRREFRLCMLAQRNTVGTEATHSVREFSFGEFYFQMIEVHFQHI